MTTIYTAYDQIAEILAKLDPAKILALKATPEMQKRLELLIEKSKNNQLCVLS